MHYSKTASVHIVSSPNSRPIEIRPLGMGVTLEWGASYTCFSKLYISTSRVTVGIHLDGCINSVKPVHPAVGAYIFLDEDGFVTYSMLRGRLHGEYISRTPQYQWSELRQLLPVTPFINGKHHGRRSDLQER
jgi:hypothetical protein